MSESEHGGRYWRTDNVEGTVAEASDGMEGVDLGHRMYDLQAAWTDQTVATAQTQADSDGWAR